MLMNHNYLVERLRRLFGASACRLQVAALPWHRTASGAIEIMLITSRDTGRWVLPKGWPEESERLCETAAREASEEAGLSGSIDTHETGRYYYSKELAGGEHVACEVLVYPLEVRKVAEKWKERRQRTRKWVTPGEAARMVNEADLGRLILAFGAAQTRVAA
ncbi:NUDIX hydrolase [Aminobacter sp. Piv2-1]|uniref:NUDIX hydrolase n=1 Tax=Aminobacter sp. Piv2-1 TaxID=3031122 RepID=UPI003096BAB7